MSASGLKRKIIEVESVPAVCSSSSAMGKGFVESSCQQSVNPEDVKRLRVFYKVFEVVNKLRASLDESCESTEASRADLLKKREMVTKLLKSFSETHAYRSAHRTSSH